MGSAALRGVRSFSSRNRLVLVSASKTLVGSMSARAATMVSALGAAGLLGATGYGTYAFVLATVGLSSGVGLLGAGPVVSREVARAAPREAARFAAVTVMTTAAASAGTAVVSLLAIEFFDIGDMRGVLHGWIRAGVVLWTVASGVSTIAQAILVGHLRFSAAAMTTLLRSAGVAAATPIGAMTTDVAGTMTAVLLTECAAAVATVAYLRRHAMLGVGVDVVSLWGTFTRIVRLGGSTGLASLLVQLSLWGGQALLMSQPGGVAANGAFAVALRIALGAAAIPTALNAVLVPILSAKRSQASGRELVLLSTGTAVASAVGAVLLLPWLLDGWLHDYSAFAVVFYVMLGSILPVVANEALGAVALAAGHFRAWIVSDVLLAGSMALIYAWTVPSAGATGLGLAYTAGYLASVALLAGRSGRGAHLWSPLGTQRLVLLRER